MFDVKLYFSGSVEHEVNEFIVRQPGTYRLATFAYKKEALDYLNMADSFGVCTTMIIDSGAFSSWSVGRPVEIADLIAYNKQLVEDYGGRHTLHLISLDVIPGEKGRRATADEIDKAVDRSYQNFLTLNQEFRTNKVLPVFHSGEDFRLRNAYLNLTDYVCLSMDQGMSESNRLEWAKRAIVPGFYFHGLAATGNKMVTQVPWFSVDSSSWITVGAMGGLLWPTSANGFRVLPVSRESPARHDKGAHRDSVSEVERHKIDEYIRSWNFDPEVLATRYTERRKWNVVMWMNTPWRRNEQPPMDLFSNA